MQLLVVGILYQEFKAHYMYFIKSHSFNTLELDAFGYVTLVSHSICLYTVQNYTKIISWSPSDCSSPCLILTKSQQISVQNKLLACSLEVIIEMTSSFLKKRDICFGGKFKVVKNFELWVSEFQKYV